MQLILWRHAQARDGTPDLARELTAHGREQARAMAAWLRPRLPEGATLIASPALRSRQTAEALAERFEIDAGIAPDASLEDHLAVIGRLRAGVCAQAGNGKVRGQPPGAGREQPADDAAALVLVGHQPTLGLLASHLLAGQALDWRVRKGAIWWLATRAREGHTRFWLRAVIDPATL